MSAPILATSASPTGQNQQPGSSLPVLSRTSCLRPGRVNTAPHLGLQERATSSD